MPCMQIQFLYQGKLQSNVLFYSNDVPCALPAIGPAVCGPLRWQGSGRCLHPGSGLRDAADQRLPRAPDSQCERPAARHRSAGGARSVDFLCVLLPRARRDGYHGSQAQHPPVPLLLCIRDGRLPLPHPPWLPAQVGSTHRGVATHTVTCLGEATLLSKINKKKRGWLLGSKFLI